MTVKAILIFLALSYLNKNLIIVMFAANIYQFFFINFNTYLFLINQKA